MERHAVFKNGKQITGSYTMERSAKFIALASGWMVDVSADFAGDWSGRTLADGYEIKPVEE